LYLHVTRDACSDYLSLSANETSKVNIDVAKKVAEIRNKMLC